MSAEENKALYRQFGEEVLEKKNLAAMDQFIADNFVEHNPIPGTANDRQGMRESMEMFFKAFPDMTSPIDFLVAEGDLVVGHHTTSATNTGEFMGMPATGKSVKLSEIHIVRIVNGKAVEHWGLVDDMSMMQQLGLGQSPS